VARTTASTAGPTGDSPTSTRLAEPRRTRFTGRMMVLLLVLSVLTISYASSLKAYFQQRNQIDDRRSQISTSQAGIDRLQSEKDQWNDPAYVKQQAHARFGYLMPGQTSYVVIGDNGKPLATQAKLSDPRTSQTSTPTAWWTTEWRSVTLAGDPPAVKEKKKPLKYLGGNHR
jgi:cell division protein FtsB